MSSGDKQEEKPSVNLINIAVPEFRDLPPEVWFAVFELELENRNVQLDRAKYAQLVPRLPRELLGLITHILVNPPQEDAYERVKQIVLADARPSEKARLEQLCHTLQLGDRKPSQLLREMQQLAGPGYLHETLLQELWLQRLPETLQAIVAVVPSCPLADLAQAADTVMERLPKGTSTSINNPSTSHAGATAYTAILTEKDNRIASLQAALTALRVTPQPAPSSEVAALRQEVAELRHLLQSREFPFRSRSRNRSSQRRSRNPSGPRRSHSRGEEKVCWYHRTHGDNARNCEPWCSRRKPDSQGN